MILHVRENWLKNFPHCGACGDLDTKSGLCKGGVHHATHANGNYCPAGKFGNGTKPPEWPHAQEARINSCRSCRARAGHVCGIDQALIRDHAREAVCPIGRYIDGVTGHLQTPSPAPALSAASTPAGKGCCGGD